MTGRKGGGRLLRARAEGRWAVAVALATAGACTQTFTLGGDQMGGGSGGAAGANNGSGGDAAGGGADPGGHDGNGATLCSGGTRRLEFDRGGALLLIALQRSSSMLLPFGGETRLGAAQGAILDVVGKTKISVGLISFPAGGFSLCSAERSCCSAALVVPPGRGFDSARSMEQAFRCRFPGPNDCFETSDAIPTAAALEAGRSLFAGFSDPRLERQVLVITDGDATCATDGEPCERASATAAVLLAAHEARTLVLGIDAAPQSSVCLDKLALAGGARSDSASFFPRARNRAEVAVALREVVTAAEKNLCTLILRRAADRPDALSITLNGRVVPFAPGEDAVVDGWRFAPSSRTRVTILGRSCDELRAAQSNDVDLVERCGSEKF